MGYTALNPRFRTDAGTIQASGKSPGTPSPRARLGEKAMAESEIPLFFVFQEPVVPEDPGQGGGFVGHGVSHVRIFSFFPARIAGGVLGLESTERKFNAQT